jgi:glutathione-regulated potassium-efflux system protein KefB
MPFLTTLVILLLAAIIAVPLAKRFGFGSVLGYLAAGLVIGPSGLGLVTDLASIGEVSELGVVMLLFLIGLELRPARLWIMRRSVFGMGALQVAGTTILLSILARQLGLSWAVAFVAGFSLSLSSTALVLPMLAERELLNAHSGRDAFAVLLFQDVAVIPVVALIPLLHGGAADLSFAEIWPDILKAVVALGIVMVGGRFLIRPIFRLVDSAKTPEIFTAAALVVVGGTAALVNAAGLSMSLGAFMAGVLLSDSEYRHELQADIEPFEGLLLGIFFISVGMSADLALLRTEPGRILAATAGLLAVKMLYNVALAKLGGQRNADAARFGVALGQAGEFGFVIFGVAVMNNVVSPDISDRIALVITLSMIASPLLFALEERFLAPWLLRNGGRPYDKIPRAHAPVIICGFGRVGQIVGRVLRLKRIPFTALDKSAEQIDLVRRFGSQAYYGDSSRLELLRAAGAAEAKVLVIALEDVSESLKVAEHALRHFPHLTILARARNRRHAHLLMDRGVTLIERETYHSSLRLTEKTLLALGVSDEEAKHTVSMFEEKDEALLINEHGYYDDEKQMIQTTRQVTEELRGLLEADRADSQ